MEINSEELTQLLNSIELVRRRKIVDKNSDITYIDPLNNISKIKIQNNNIISVRRGCGKTTIMLTSIHEKKNNTSINVECQHHRRNESDETIINF